MIIMCIQIANDEDRRDQELLEAGLNYMNIDTYCSVLEERIDAIIQASPISLEDRLFVYIYVTILAHRSLKQRRRIPSAKKTSSAAFPRGRVVHGEPPLPLRS